MYDYGIAPAADEIELTLFGPGYGEAIAIHRGDGGWMLVDSCLSPQTRAPASLEYLQRISVPFTAVHTIVASHWHDDHVKGLSKVVESCPIADFHISSVFNNKEARAFLAAFGGKSAQAHSAGAKELVKAVSAAREVMPTNHKTLLWEGNVLGRRMRAVAFSPTPQAVSHSVARFAQLLPKVGDAIKHIPELQPNLEAIVINVELGDESILLGSDLEDHGNLGWNGIVNDQFCVGNRPAATYKVAHHGSITAEHAEIWSRLLEGAPTSILTPFIHGSVQLPTNGDRQRIVANSGASFISSEGSRRPQLDKVLERRMSAIAKKLTPVNTGFGVIRLRKKLGAKTWTSELFGNAGKIG